jgi:hypothetical protein
MIVPMVAPVAIHVQPSSSYTARHRAEMIKQTRTKGLLKLKTTVLILALILSIPLTAASASQIVIEDADTIWNVTSDYPPKLINTTDNVTPRVTIESANTNLCEELIYPKEFMADMIPPVIADISVINLVNNSAKVTWKTDEFADSVLKYGMNSTAYIETCIDVLFVKEHEITLTGLSPDTTHYFVVHSTDQSGNSAESAEYRFKYDW